MDTVAQQQGLTHMSPESGSALLANLFAHSPDGVAFIGPDFAILAANQCYANQVGVPLERLVGLQAEEAIPGWTGQVGDVYQKVRETVMAFKADAHPFRFADQPDRGVTYWDSSVSPVTGPDGVFQGYLLLQRDVTGRARAREKAEALRTVAMELNEEGRLADGVRAALVKASGLMGGEGGSLLLLEGDELRGALDLWAGRESGTVLRLEEWPNYARAMEGRRAVYLTLEGAEGGERELFERLGLSGCLLSPLVAGNRPLGLLCTNYRRAGCVPPSEDLELAESLASQIASTIQRAQVEAERERLLERVQAQNEKLRVQAEELQTQTEKLQVQREEIVTQNEELRGAAHALAESEERFRSVFHQAAVGIAQVGLDGRFLEFNERLCAITGRDPSELSALIFQDITHPDDLEADLGQAERLLRGEIQSYSMEKRYFRKDGSVVWVNLTASAVREGSGEPTYYVAVVEDITERKRAEILAEATNSIDSVIRSTLSSDEVVRRAIALAAEAIGGETAALSIRRGDQWVVSLAMSH